MDDRHETYDWWFVFDDLASTENAVCPPDQTVLIASESVALKKYPKFFTDQFHYIISSQERIKHPQLILDIQGFFPWLTGLSYYENSFKDSKIPRMDLDYYASHSFKKNKELSIICSAKRSTPGHKKRYEFVHQLYNALNGNIDWFGTGINKIKDKHDAIAPYKYHITIENTSEKNHFTEKIADVFLCETFPIYHGCTNLKEYFDPRSFVGIDINYPEKAINTIKMTIKNKLYEQNKKQIELSKELVLNKYNLFAIIDGFAINHQGKMSHEKVTLKPIKDFTLLDHISIALKGNK